MITGREVKLCDLRLGRKVNLSFSIGDEAWVLAKDVLCASKRPDICTKFDMASSFIKLGYFPEDTRSRYQEEIFALNGFFENEPKKIGYQAFEDHFKELILSLEKNGYSLQDPPVPVTINLEALNGAHRVATASALRQRIRIRVVDQRPSFDFRFFQGKVSGRTLELAALTYIRESEGIRALILHASLAPKVEETVTREFEGLWEPFYSKALPPNRNLYLNLKKINYSNPREAYRSSWVGSPGDNFAGLRSHVAKSYGPHEIRVIFFHPRGSSNELEEAKKRSRENLGGQKHFIHSTDSHLETFMLASAILHEESLLALSNRPANWSTPLDQVISSYSPSTTSDALPSGEILFGGSVSLDGHGIRKCNDVDLLTDSISDFSRLSVLFAGDTCLDANLPHENSYSSSSAEMSSDYSAHFYVNGMKLAALKEIADMKQRRSRGAKDELDLLSITKYISKNSPTKGAGGFRQSLRGAARSLFSGKLQSAYELYLKLVIAIVSLLSTIKGKLMRR